MNVTNAKYIKNERLKGSKYEVDGGKGLVYMRLMMDAPDIIERIPDEIKQKDPKVLCEELAVYINSLQHPSRLSTWIAELKCDPDVWDLFTTYHEPNGLLSIPYIEVWNTRGLGTSISIPVELNRVSPIATGHLIEGLMALAIDEPIQTDVMGIVQVFDPDALLATISKDDLQRLHELSFGSCVPIMALRYAIISVLSKVRANDEGRMLEELFNLIEYIKRDTNMYRINSYYEELRRSPYIASIRSAPFKRHGMQIAGEVNGVVIKGEADFIVDDRVIDAKVYKQVDHRDITRFMMQTYLYAKACGRTITRLEIVSFMNSTIYITKLP